MYTLPDAKIETEPNEMVVSGTIGESNRGPGLINCELTIR